MHYTWGKMKSMKLSKRCGRINIKGHFNLQRLPWLLINQRDISGHLDRDISLATGLYTGRFL